MVNLKTIGFSSERKLDRKQDAKLHKENKRKKEYMYNMGRNCFLARNKEIFAHGLFVDIRFPYFFLAAHCSFVSKDTCIQSVRC